MIAAGNDGNGIAGRLMAVWVLTMMMMAGVALVPLPEGVGPVQEAEGATIIVATDGTGDFKSIQEAINNASYGSTVTVMAGTYFENVVIDKTIDLRGQGADSTIINGGNTGTVILVTADDVHISGLGVRKSGVADYPHYNAGIRVSAGHNVSISQVNCSGNLYGMYLSSPYIVQRDCIIDDCTLYRNQRGLQGWRVSDLTIRESSFYHNDDYEMAFLESEDVVLEGNDIESGTGMGVTANDCMYLVITGNTMVNCGLALHQYETQYDQRTHTITDDNLVNGEPILYLKNIDGGTYEGDHGQVILAGCEDVIVRNMNCSGATNGISLLSCHDVTVENCTTSNGGHSGLLLTIKAMVTG
jgi:nitrous oxidase accessory protein NosD